MFRDARVTSVVACVFVCVCVCVCVCMYLTCVKMNTHNFTRAGAPSDELVDCFDAHKSTILFLATTRTYPLLFISNESPIMNFLYT